MHKELSARTVCGPERTTRPDGSARIPKTPSARFLIRVSTWYSVQDLEAFVAFGHLDHLDVAFSRDQRNKIHVQDRMREHGPRLWRWLEDGAHLYVCGDAGRMAKDVDRVLREIVAAHGGLDADSAAAHVWQLAGDKGYVRDIQRPQPRPSRAQRERREMWLQPGHR